MRLLCVFLLLPALALADEIDLSRARGRDESARPPTVVVKVEAGNEFAPFGYVGGALSWLADPYDELELGGGGGFPGLQLGFAARRLFTPGPQHFLAELFLAGNTRVNRGVDNGSRLINAPGAQASSSLWTGLGFGVEQRSELLTLSVAANIIFATTSLTPHWSVHGGLGFGF